MIIIQDISLAWKLWKDAGNLDGIVVITQLNVCQKIEAFWFAFLKILKYVAHLNRTRKWNWWTFCSNHSASFVFRSWLVKDKIRSFEATTTSVKTEKRVNLSSPFQCISLTSSHTIFRFCRYNRQPKIVKRFFWFYIAGKTVAAIDSEHGFGLLCALGPFVSKGNNARKEGSKITVIIKLLLQGSSHNIEEKKLIYFLSWILQHDSVGWVSIRYIRMYLYIYAYTCIRV